MTKVLVSSRHLDMALALDCRICIPPNNCGGYYIVVIMDTPMQRSKFIRSLSKNDVIIRYG